jgi:hypothetical protein
MDKGIRLESLVGPESRRLHGTLQMRTGSIPVLLAITVYMDSELLES